ncbi:MAG TPA: lysophospholipid acyltransferase family protein [Candidatus Sumerlaeota bacterium]|nr:lysophospholipid acyltransferase family protein [Candidatus Sumerlaeota bacterium]
MRPPSPDPRAGLRGDLLFRWVVIPLVALLIRLIVFMQRRRYVGLEHFRAAIDSGRPVVWAFWHEDLIGMAMTYLHLKSPRDVAIMISRSRDGDRLARLMQRLGARPVRASSSRGAVRGFLEVLRRLRPGDAAPGTVAIALDGPRGPRRQPKPGAALLARKAGALIVPVAFHHQRQWVFGSWDRTRLPKPFTRTTCVFGEPLDASRWDDEAALLQRMVEALDQMHGAAPV